MIPLFLRRRTVAALATLYIGLSVTACSQATGDKAAAGGQASGTGATGGGQATSAEVVAHGPATGEPAAHGQATKNEAAGAGASRGHDEAPQSELASYRPSAKVVPGQPTSFRDAYPDYRPGADDPELESTRTGRREVAPHDWGFEIGGAASLEDLVAAVVSGVDRADGPALDRTAVTHGDFAAILWPEMPQSRPAAGVPVEEAWDFLRRRHLAAFNRSMGDWNGKGLTVQNIAVGSVENFTNFRLHTDIQVTVTDATGNVSVFPMIRTVAECRGRFKLYSTRD